MNTKRMGVLLTQLGTPKAATQAAVRPFLREFLSDPRVIDISGLARAALVNLIIVPFRTPKSTKIYQELWEVAGGESPIMVHTQALTEALNQRLSDHHITVHMAMRYQEPSMDKVLEDMRLANYDKILILPMVPHYASSSTGTAIQKAMEIIAKWWVIPEVEVVNQFYTEDFYLDTLVDQAQKHDIASYDHIIMSYHGLPDRHVDKVYEGDNLCQDKHCDERVDDNNKHCYKATAYETSRLLAKKMGLDPKDYTTTFQSRLDDKWLTPFSDEVIEDLAKDGKKRLLVFSPAFVADCLETLIEIGSEYQEIFEEHGGETVQLVESCNTETRWIDGLAEFIQARS